MIKNQLSATAKTASNKLAGIVLNLNLYFTYNTKLKNKIQTYLSLVVTNK
jgi:hypothetical protein